LTGSFEPFDEDKAKSCGADDFLSKPFESQQIVTKVKELYEKGASQAASPATEPEIPAAAIVPEQGDASATLSIAEETTVADDIWGAFTAPEATDSVQDAPAREDESTGSQWIPVKEETFEFEEEAAVEPPASDESNQTTAVEESMFGDVQFEAAVPETSVAEVEEAAPVISTDAPAFREPSPVVDVPEDQPIVASASAAAVAALTEDQLREALTAASREVIERIVWEVVPDLAEAMIKEAIRKIKEGV
jgi:CheY-like chemotaxis protein